MPDTAPKHLVFTNSFNAAAMARGLALLGKTLESAVPPPGLVPQAARPPQPGDTLFFTEERSLKQFIGDDRYCLLPRSPRLIVDDKLQFSQWLKERRAEPAPFAAALDAPTPFPVVLKAKHSWHGDRSLPRGFICRSPHELATSLQALDRQGLRREWFFLQAYIEGTGHVFSTCGFFDCRNQRRNAILVLRRALSTGAGLQSGAIVETAPDPGGLVERTERILEDMDYTGPFELEFLRDRDGRFYILELNPRFWLQHGLFIDFFDNVLLRRYIDPRDETPFAGVDSAAQRVVWLNTWFCLQAALRGDAKTLSAFAGAVRQHRRGKIKAAWYPSWRQAFSWFANGPYRRIARAVRRRFPEMDAAQAA